MKEFLIILFVYILFVNMQSFGADDNVLKAPTDNSCYTDKLDYGNYVEPSQTVYDAEQEMYIENNYGSSESMDYLNRGDASFYNGGDDFDRNYE